MPVIHTISTETDGREKYITSVINNAHKSRKNVLRDFIFLEFICIRRNPMLTKKISPIIIRTITVSLEKEYPGDSPKRL
jgi:hypothetical protein